MPQQDDSATEQTLADLKTRLAELEAANVELTRRLEGEPTVQIPVEQLAVPRRRGRGRGVAAVVLIVLASLLTPVSALAGWARVVLTDTDSFVATYAPLAEDPQVQTFITDEVLAAIEQQVDIESLVGEITVSIGSLVEQPLAKSALDLLKQPAVDGVRSAIRTATSNVVSSDQFAEAWRESLKLSHSQLVLALQGDPNSLLTVQSDGIGLRLAPLIAKVKQYLVDQGFALADRIPEVDRTIPIASAEALPAVQQAYRLTLVAGFWLAPVVLAMFVIGVLLSRRRALATVWAAVGLGLGAGLVVAAVSIGRVVLLASVPVSVVPPNVLGIFYDTVGDTIQDIGVATMVLALVVGLTAWLAGPFVPAVRLRTAYSELRQVGQDQVEARGVSTGKVGEFLFAYRIGIRILIGALALAFLLSNRPLSPGLVIGTAAVALLVLLAHSLLLRTPSPEVVVELVAEAEAEAEPTQVLRD